MFDCQKKFKNKFNLLGLSLLLFCSSGFAQIIKSISANTTRVAPGMPVTFTVELAPRNNSAVVMCGVKFDFGNGENMDMRLDQSDSQTLKFNTQRAFPSPGNFTVTVSGNSLRRGLASVFACEGEPQRIMVQVVDVEKIRLQQELNRVRADEQERARRAEIETRDKAALDQERARRAEIETREKASLDKNRELEQKVRELEELARKNSQAASKPPEKAVTPLREPPVAKERKQPTAPPSVDDSGSKKSKADSIL
jgi:hypothetical protein